MAITTPAEYRKGSTKEISLSSGVRFVIRKMPIEVMTEVLERLNLGMPKGLPKEQSHEELERKMQDPKFVKNIVSAATYSVPHIVVKPKIGKSGEHSDEILSVDEIGPGDLIETFMEGLIFSGLIGVTAKMREKFRPESLGPSDKKPSPSPPAAPV